MSYYPPPSQGQGYSVAYHPPSHLGSNPSGQYSHPAPFPTDQYGQYGPPGSHIPPELDQYPLYGQYPPPGPEHYPPPGQPYASGHGQPNYGGGPIVDQPMQSMGGDWMAIPQGIPNCPPGLEYLISLSNLFVKQKVEFLEVFTGFETKNKFTIKNDRGEKLYWAAEESDMCTRLCCGQLRPFEMRIMDAHKREVIHLHRPLNCAACCFPCCLQRMEVFSPPGNLLGTIEQDWSLLYPQFSINDAAGVTVLKIEGPCCGLAFCGQADFQVLSRDGQVRVGKISKEWSGFARELFTDADFFGVSFPQDLDVRMKAVMIGAVFLIALSKDKRFTLGEIKQHWDGFLRELLMASEFFGVAYPKDLAVGMKALLLGSALLIDGNDISVFMGLPEFKSHWKGKIKVKAVLPRSCCEVLEPLLMAIC